MAPEPALPSHWNAQAARWQRIGAPLRPSPSDIEHLRASVARHLIPNSAGDAAARALLLGVTPEIAVIDWNPPLALLAADKSPGMIAAAWPGDTERRRVLERDWFALSEPNGDFSLVVGDGVFSLLAYPVGYVRLADELSRWLRPGGLFAVRLFCRSEPAESVGSVFDALFEGLIGNFHAFKWRLAMALQGDATRGVRLADIWRVYREQVGSNEALAARTGFPEPEVATIDGYRDVEDRYSFATPQEVIGVLASSFELVEQWQPDYELGERCPHLTFQRLTR